MLLRGVENRRDPFARVGWLPAPAGRHFPKTIWSCRMIPSSPQSHGLVVDIHLGCYVFVRVPFSGSQNNPAPLNYLLGRLVRRDPAAEFQAIRLVESDSNSFA